MKRGERLAVSLLQAGGRFFSTENPYYHKLQTNPREAFAYSIRSGEVVLSQFFPFNDLKGKSVLDFGCGQGGKTLYYAMQGAKSVIGVDFTAGSPLAAEIIEEKDLPVRFEPLTEDGTTTLADGEFDVILLSSVLEHAMDLPKALFELHRLLKPGALLLNRWHPFRTRNGSHMAAAVPLPFAHLLFSEKNVVRAFYLEQMRLHGRTPDFISLDEHSESFADCLGMGLNRISVAAMKRMIEMAGFDIIERRYYINTTPVPWVNRIPETIRDFFFDYELHIARKIV